LLPVGSSRHCDGIAGLRLDAPLHRSSSQVGVDVFRGQDKDRPGLAEEVLPPQALGTSRDLG